MMSAIFPQLCSPGPALVFTPQRDIPMGSFGERLQREREMRGITLDEIATATKISARSLRALEEEDFSKLPGGIFNKGFVRAYAHYLGIDEEEAVADFVAVHGEAEQPLPNPPEKEEEPGRRKSGGAQWVAIVVLLAVVGSFAAWRTGKLKLPGRRARPANTASQVPPTPAPQTSAAVPATASVPPLTGGRGNAPGANAATPAASQSSATSSSSSQTRSAPANTAFTLDIKARQDSWVDIWVDGKHLEAETIKAAGERSFSANQKIVLHAGNAGGLEFSHNGKPLTVAAKEGETRTFTFTPDGLQQ